MSDPLSKHMLDGYSKQIDFIATPFKLELCTLAFSPFYLKNGSSVKP